MYGDRAPVISNATHLYTTLSTDARTVKATITDDNPSGGNAGVAQALLHYVIGTDTTEVAMTNTDDLYSADIPGQTPGTVVTYWVSAKDVMGNETANGAVTYSIFKPVEPVLFVYDDDTFPAGFITPYYWFGVNDSIFAFDTWEGSYGPVTDELLSHYQIVYHVMGGGPVNQPSDIGAIYKSWLDGATADMPLRLFISGQDYGYISGFADTTFAAGAFEYDYLGIETLGPQDINYDGTSDSYKKPYAINAVSGNILTGDIAAYAADSLQLFYSPSDELGFNNWIDNLTPVAGAEVDFTDPNQSDAAVAIHNEGDNWKTVFWTLDPVALDLYDPADTSSSYHWVLTDVGNPLVNVLNWFGAPVTGIADGNEISPMSFTLKQNYPNPFNPTTTIKYSVPNNGKVQLTVFDIQGRKVSTLVNSVVTAGAHTVNFNGAHMASGIYFYQLKAGNTTLIRKMTLVK